MPLDFVTSSTIFNFIQSEDTNPVTVRIYALDVTLPSVCSVSGSVWSCRCYKYVQMFQVFCFVECKTKAWTVHGVYVSDFDLIAVTTKSLEMKHHVQIKHKHAYSLCTKCYLHFDNWQTLQWREIWQPHQDIIK